MAEAMTMPRYVNMLVWGGPRHGEMAQADPSHSFWLFPIERRLTARSMLTDASEIGPAVQSVRYTVEQVAFGSFDRRIWYVLVYGENYEAHKQRLIDVANALARLCTLEWMLDD